MPSLLKAGNGTDTVLTDICPGEHPRCFAYFGVAVALFILLIALIVCLVCYKQRHPRQTKPENGSYNKMDEEHANDTKAASHTTNRLGEWDRYTNRDPSIEDETQPPDTNDAPSSEQNYNKDTLAPATTKLQNEEGLYQSLNDPSEIGVSENKSEQASDDEGRVTNDIPPESQPVDETFHMSKQLEHLSLENGRKIETDKEQCREDSPVIVDDLNKPYASAFYNLTDNIGVIDSQNEGVGVIDKPNKGAVVIDQPNEDVGVIDRPNEDVGVIDRPNEDVGVIDRPNEDVGVIDRPNEDVGVIDRPKEVVGVIDRPNEDVGVIDRPNEVVGVIDKTIYVQVYMSQGTANVVQKGYEELLSKLMSKSGFKIDYTFVQDVASVNPVDPLLIMCMHASRLGTDAKNALKGLLYPKTAALVILHYKDEGALPLVRSDHVLFDPIFETIAGIIDFAYLAKRGMYSCKMNTTCIRELEDFIGNFKKIP